jgi:hypothetical protein
MSVAKVGAVALLLLSPSLYGADNGLGKLHRTK